MTISYKKCFGAIVFSAGLLVAPLANAGALTDFQKRLDGTHDAVHNVLLAKFILELTMGQGRPKADNSGKHAAWCAKIHSTYDASSNTFTALNGKQYQCRSLYQ